MYIRFSKSDKKFHGQADKLAKSMVGLQLHNENSGDLAKNIVKMPPTVKVKSFLLLFHFFFFKNQSTCKHKRNQETVQ